MEARLGPLVSAIPGGKTADAEDGSLAGIPESALVMCTGRVKKSPGGIGEALLLERHADWTGGPSDAFAKVIVS